MPFASAFSIVAASASKTADRLTCLNLVSPDFDGDERRYALREHDLADDLHRRCAHGLGRLDDVRVDLPQAALDQAGDERERGDDQRHDRCRGADDGPDDGWNGPMPGFLSVSFGS